MAPLKSKGIFDRVPHPFSALPCSLDANTVNLTSYVRAFRAGTGARRVGLCPIGNGDGWACIAKPAVAMMYAKPGQSPKRSAKWQALLADEVSKILQTVRKLSICAKMANRRLISAFGRILDAQKPLKSSSKGWANALRSAPFRAVCFVFQRDKSWLGEGLSIFRGCRAAAKRACNTSTPRRGPHKGPYQW